MKQFLLAIVLVFSVTLCAAEKNVSDDKLVGVFPENIKCVAVMSPASCPSKKNVLKGIAMLEKAGVKVKLMPHSFVPKGASIEQRLEAWNLAVNDPEVDMIIATRGGNGAQDLVKHIDWKKFKERNLTLMGFSNITHLTSAMEFHNAGRPIAGPNISNMVKATPRSIVHLKSVLAKQPTPRVKLVPLRGGDVSGRAYAGHLTMLNGNRQSEFKVVPDGRIVFIECVRRDTKVLDECFQQMFADGYFKNVKAVVLCHFTNLKDPENKDKMIEKWAAQLTCPVYKGYPYGHTSSSYAIDFKSTAVIKNNAVTFVQE